MFAEYTFMDYALLNIDADPRMQGCASQEFDLLISTNCLVADIKEDEDEAAEAHME